MKGHSRLSPSSAGIWVNCPGAVILQEQHPGKSDNLTRVDGDTAHVLGSQALSCGVSAAGVTAARPEGASTADPVVLPGVTDEIVDAVRVYVDSVRAIVGPTPPVRTEYRVGICGVHPDCFGTMDAWWYDADSHVVHIWDLKYGWGIVEAVNNWQLLMYAIGHDAVFSTSAEYHLHIVQPRAPHREGPVRTWKLSANELIKYRAIAHDAALVALSDNPMVNTGPHCRYCSALYACEAADKAVLFAVDVSDSASAPTPELEQLGRKLLVLRRAAEIVKHQLAAVEQVAMAMCSAGKTVPGWDREVSAGRLEWDAGRTDNFTQIAALCGVDIFKPPALKTPTQVVKAGVPKELVAQYSKRKAGAAKLVPVKDSHIMRIFQNEPTR